MRHELFLLWVLRLSPYLCVGNIYFLLDQVHSSEVQQHPWVSMVGLYSRLVVHSFLDTHGSTLDALQLEQNTWYITTGKLWVCLDWSNFCSQAVLAFFVTLIFSYVRGSPSYVPRLRIFLWTNQRRKLLNWSTWLHLLTT